jgi:hypothetical protein
MVSFQDLQQNPDNYKKKIYVAVTPITTNGKIRDRQVFVEYNGGNNFTYYSLDGTKMEVTYPRDFHDSNVETNFLEISQLPKDVLQKILSYGSAGGKRRKTRGKKRGMKRKSRKHN